MEQWNIHIKVTSTRTPTPPLYHSVDWTQTPGKSIEPLARQVSSSLSAQRVGEQEQQEHQQQPEPAQVPQVAQVIQVGQVVHQGDIKLTIVPADVKVIATGGEV